MRKIKLLAICVLATFASCSWFNSKPIQPKIVGTAYLWYNAENDAYYATIDSVQYCVSCISVSNDDHFNVQKIKPIDGTKVTVFTNSESELCAAAGEKTVAEIEELYRCNYTPLAFVFGLALVLFIMMLINYWPKKEKDHEKTAVAAKCDKNPEQ